jgi:hypothetical protein
MKFVSLALLASMFALSDPLPAQTAQDVLGSLDFAKNELDQKRPETAGKSLREAYAALKLLSSAEKKKVGKAEKELSALIRKIDPKGKKLVDVSIKAAKDLQRLGRAYSKSGWDETALETFLAAQTLVPSLVTDDLVNVREKLGEIVGRRFAKAGRNKDLLTWFHLGERHGHNTVPWHFSNYGIMAPKTDTDSGEPRIISNKKLEGDVSIKIEIKPGPASRASFLWNYRRVLKDRIYRVTCCRVELDTKNSTVTVHQIEGSTEQAVGSGTLIMDTFRTKWIPIEIEQKGKTVTIRLADNKPITFTAFAKNKGYMGMSSATKSRADPQAQFQHLSVKHLD